MEIEKYFCKAEMRMEGEGKMLVGHAAVFNSLSVDLGGFKEKIAPGAFMQTCNDPDVRCLFNHSSDMVLGRCKSNTLRCKEDATGLAIECDLPNTTYANDLKESIKRGDIDQMSFAFQIMASNDEVWEQTENGTVRTVLRCKLYDVSPVTFPAYPQTDVGVRLRGLFALSKRDEQGGSPDANGIMAGSLLDPRAAMLEFARLIQNSDK